MLSSVPDEFSAAKELLERRFGPVDSGSDLFPFEATHYYDDELGTPIQKQFLAFDRLIDPGRLASIKCFTNELEHLRARERGTQPSRPINLDPGYLDASRLVLATTKDRAHRIYLGQGIYAEVTLMYEQGAWRPLPWTYPDYSAPTYHPFLVEARESYLVRLRSGG
jgi:hypothetical protein